MPVLLPGLKRERARLHFEFCNSFHFLLKLSPDESGQTSSEVESARGTRAENGQTCVTSHTFIPCHPCVVNNQRNFSCFRATLLKPRKGCTHPIQADIALYHEMGCR